MLDVQLPQHDIFGHTFPHICIVASATAWIWAIQGIAAAAAPEGEKAKR